MEDSSAGKSTSPGLPAASVAMTTLIAPFGAVGGRRLGPEARAERILGRVVPGLGHKSVRSEAPIWVRHEKLPLEVEELTPPLRALFDIALESDDEYARPRGRSTEDRTRDRVARGTAASLYARAQIFSMHDRVAELLRRTRLHLRSGPHFDALLHQVFLVLYPNDTGAVLLTIDWNGDGSAGALPVRDRLLDLVYHARHCYWDDTRTGWSFPAARDRCVDEEAPAGFDPLSGGLAPGGGPIQMRDLLRWCVDAGRDDSSLRISVSRYLAHQTVAVLETPRDMLGQPVAPDEAELRELCFRLRRGYHARYHYGEESDRIDRVLRPRKNRMVGISREGCASISWVVSGNDSRFDLERWPALFVGTRRRQGAVPGVYLLLAMHLRVDKAILGELSRQIAVRAGRIRETQIGAPSKSAERARLAGQKRQLHRLRREILKHTLGTTFVDCGGPSGYVGFWEALREVLRLPAELSEIRAELSELDSEIGSTYESQRRRYEARVSYFVAGLTVLVVPTAFLQASTSFSFVRELVDANQVLSVALLGGSMLGLGLVFWLFGRRAASLDS